MVNRSDRDPLSLNDPPSYELLGEMRCGSAESIRARRLRSAQQAGYKPAASSVGHHTKEPLHIGRRPYKAHDEGQSKRVGCTAATAGRVAPVSGPTRAGISRLELGGSLTALVLSGRLYRAGGPGRV